MRFQSSWKEVMSGSGRQRLCWIVSLTPYDNNDDATTVVEWANSASSKIQAQVPIPPFQFLIPQSIPLHLWHYPVCWSTLPLPISSLQPPTPCLWPGEIMPVIFSPVFKSSCLSTVEMVDLCDFAITIFLCLNWWYFVVFLWCWHRKAAKL